MDGHRLRTETQPTPPPRPAGAPPPTTITAVHLTPVLVADPPLLNVQGVHQPHTPRLIIEVTTAGGATGLGETYGDTVYLDLADRKSVV